MADFFSLEIPSPGPRHEGNPVVQEGPLAKAHLETSLAGEPWPDGRQGQAWLAAACRLPLAPPTPGCCIPPCTLPAARSPRLPRWVCVRPRGRGPLPLGNFLDLTGPAEPRAVAIMALGVHSVGICVHVGLTPDYGVPL